jgi:selenide,water dikinase
LLSGLRPVADPNLIVGYATSDDAGVYRLNDELAIVVTADFITPPFDDPVLFGQIGAANAMSDVYAMGGRPLTCLNIVGFPSKHLGADILAGIISSAADKITEAGAVLAGGHTVDDLEPKFGLAVTGVVHPERCWRNDRAQIGDALILTKPIGSGVILNANLEKWVAAADLTACIESLVSLNKTAAEVAGQFDVHAATDVTGFGFACHALEMARGAKLQFETTFSSIPQFDGALAMYQRGVTTGSNPANREMAGDDVDFAHSFTPIEQELLFDPQTNGGLLFSVPESQADDLVAALRNAGMLHAACIGGVSAYQEGPHLVVR